MEVFLVAVLDIWKVSVKRKKIAPIIVFHLSAYFKMSSSYSELNSDQMVEAGQVKRQSVVSRLLSQPMRGW